MDPITIALGIAKLTGLDKKIGGWIGGDNGSKVASKVVDIAQTITNGGTPEQALNLVQQSSALQQELRQTILNREKELDELAFKNTQSARNMQIQALKQDDKFSKRFIYYYAWFWSFATVTYIGCITFLTIPDTATRFADTILGFILGTVVATILNFFFGNSSDNSRRSEIQDIQQSLKEH
ncbi:hypothetical protein FQP85_03015 [Pseudoalteromonas neustonica]|uniref:Uncharacterized protein n=1 Tax=Pseudoalteromonas neustonica TaxID=1840331 RepID=A0ABY3FIV8_9GAMM|nr:hypothetical protein [Pseudoalteromonas neustonica]TVU86060.1 hypothetical protein FQP85_03015 [Pseudoalteromonas neustonica]